MLAELGERDPPICILRTLTHTCIHTQSAGPLQAGRLFVEKDPLLSCPLSQDLFAARDPQRDRHRTWKRGKSFFSHKPEWKPKWKLLWLFNTKMGNFIKGLLSGQLRFLTEPVGHPAGNCGVCAREQFPKWRDCESPPEDTRVAVKEECGALW